MSRVITFDKGSRRRLRKIQWTARERLGAAALFLLLVGFCITVALWSASGPLNGTGEHRLEIRRR